jgi:hypothetical protein
VVGTQHWLTGCCCLQVESLLDLGGEAGRWELGVGIWLEDHLNDSSSFARSLTTQACLTPSDEHHELTAVDWVACMLHAVSRPHCTALGC